MIGRFIRYNSWAIVLVLSLGIILGFGAGVRNESGRSTLYIKDIAGDPSVLDDVVITGVLKDGFHGQRFEISGRRIDRDFIYHEHSRDNETDPAGLVYANSLYLNGLTYIYELNSILSPDADISYSREEEQNETDGQYYRIERKKGNKLDIYANITVINFQGGNDDTPKFFKMNTGIKLEGDDGEFEISKKYRIDPGNPEAPGNSHPVEDRSYIDLPRPASRLAQGLVQMNGRIYFTVLTTRDYSGTNGIYAIDRYSSMWEMAGLNPKETGSASTVTNFSLNDHDTAVLGLEAAEGKLILIMSINNVLTLRAYNPEDGSLAGELAVTGIKEADSLEDYLEFIDGNTLNLAFKDTIVSVGIEEDNISLKHLVQGIDFNNEYLDIFINKICEVNGRLFIFSNVNRRDEGNNPIQELRPKHFMLHVFSGSNLIYIGEFINDSDEDYEADRRRNSSTFGYNYRKYRQFESVSVKGR